MNTQLCRTVLIVEDCPEDREMYRRYLLRDRDYDYTIVETSFGNEGLNLWRQHQPDAVLLDYQLPDLDGLEFLAALQTQQPLPIVMMTGVGSETIAVQAIKAGAQDYLVKGQITPQSLKLALDATIKTVQLQTQLQERIDRERVIAQIAQNVSRSLDLDEILHTTVVEVRQFLQTDRVVVFQVEAGGNGRVVAESVGAEWRSILSEQIYDPCFAESYVDPQRQGRVTVKADIYDGSIDPCHVQLLAGCQVRANLVVPILHDNQFWGVLIAHHCAAPRQWKPLEIDLLEQLSTQVSVAIRQAELYQQAQTELAERKRTEEVLRSSEERLRLAMSGAHAGSWDWEIPTGMIVWSAENYVLYGLDPANGLPSYAAWENALHPEDRDRANADIQAVLEQRLPEFRSEFRIVHPQLGVRWLLGLGCITFNQQAESVQLSGINLDITARKQTEIALQESEQRYKALIDITAQIVWNADADGTILNSNSGIFTGQSQEEYQGWGWMEAIHPDDRQRTSEVWLLAVANLTPYEIEHRLRRWDGEYRLMSARAVPLLDADGSVREWVGMHTDITEARQDELNLRRSEEFNRRILENNQDCIKVLDLEGRLLYMNDGGKRLLEIADFADYDRSLWTQFWGGSEQELAQAAFATATAGTIGKFEGQCPTATGVPKWWEVSVIPLHDADGHVEQILVISHDVTERRQAEDELRQAQALVQSQLVEIEAIYQTAPIGLAILDVDLRFERVNHRLAEMNGVSIADHIGRTVRDVLGDLADGNEPLLRQVLETGEALLDLELSGETSAQPGIYRTWISNFHPLKDSTGQSIGINVVVQEITDRKQIEQELVASAERLKAGIEVSGVGLVKFNFAINLVELSPEASALYGFSPDESVVTQEQIHATFHPDERVELEQVIARAIDPAGHGWFAQDHRVVWPNGEVRHLSIRAQVFFDRSGAVHRPSYAILAAIDITDRKQQELNNNFLAEIQKDLAVIENIGQIINIVGEKIRLWFDFSIIAFSDIDVDADAARTIYADQDDDTRNALGVHRLSEYLSEIHLQELQSGQNVAIEDVYTDPKVKDGGRAYDAWQVRSIVNIPYISNSKLKFIMVCARQMPSFWREDELELMGELILRIYIEIERIRAESALAEINQRLKERNQELNRFSYIVSHDLKAPLRGISNLAAWIRDDLPPTIDPDILTNLDLMRSRVDRMDSLITGLLEYARVGSNAASLATFRVEQILAEIVDSLSIPDSFVVELPAELPPITTNRVLLSQVLANLIGNAYKHHDRPDGRIQVTVQPDAQMWEFSVTDDGRGIAPANQAEVFDIFRTLSGADKNHTGIGLSIVKKLVETQGGEITLESQIGIGTTFKFTWLSEI